MCDMNRFITVEKADEHIRSSLPDFGVETVPVTDIAGRILRQTIHAERDLPPFDRVMMDGIAIRHESWSRGTREFVREGIAAAGGEPMALQSDTGCVEVMTGAVMPAGTDCVVPVERIENTDGAARVDADYVPEPDQFIHPRGSDQQSGAVLLQPGLRLGGPEAAVAAAAGLSGIQVARLPTIGVVSVGDELVEPGEPIEPHQVRRSNDFGIEVAIRARHAGNVTRLFVKDDRDAMTDRIGACLEACDALVLSGGVSMGKYDFVPAVLEALGIELIFHKVSQRPGRPMWFGRSAEGKPVFALPGNPVSAAVCLSRYVLPSVEHAMGLTATSPRWISLSRDVTFEPDLTFFLPVRVSSSDDGVLSGLPARPNTSGDFSSLAGTDGFVELPRGRDRFRAGYAAQLWPW
jgi:molybdopterin molybdotransferase